ncbi:MAG: uroporphyrinogen-III C-methyltransferase [Treponemataceae bacterium]
MVVLVGAGMGEDDLLSLKAKKYLQKANIIMYDRLIDMRVLLYANPSSQFIRVGKAATDGGHQQKEINEKLISYGKKYSLVVRLQGGDPFVFGRGGEEVYALQSEGIPFEVIPGISSIYAAPSYAGIPVTQRDCNASFHVFTAHRKKDKADLDYATIAHLEGNLIFLMGSQAISTIANNLIAQGKNPQTPVALIHNAGTCSQKEFFLTLDQAQHTQKTDFHSPLVIIIGKGISNKYAWFKKPLFNLAIIGEQHSLKRFCLLTEHESFRVIPIPVLEASVCYSLTLNDLSETKIALFTSANAVRFAFKNIPFHLWHKMHFGAIGKNTEKELQKHAVQSIFTTHNGSYELIKKAVEHSNDDNNILLCTSSESDLDENQLSAKYHRHFKVRSCYTTKHINWQKEVLFDVHSRCQLLAFTSGMAVKAFFKNLSQEEKPSGKIFALGSTAKKALEDEGLFAQTPQNPSFESLLECIKSQTHHTIS